MTHTHKAIAAQKRANPTEIEDLLWQEIKALNTAARFTRKKYRYGILCDFYCAGLNLAILLDDPDGRKEQRHFRKVETIGFLVDRGLRVEVVSAADVLASPGAVKVKLTQLVYKILIGQVTEPVMKILGVKSVKLVDDYKIEVELVGIQTPEILKDIYHTIGSRAPGAQVFIKQEVGVEPSPQVVAEPVASESSRITEI